MAIEDLDRYTDILGQLPRLKTYTHILLCFSLEQDAVDVTVDALQDAVQQLIRAFPWLGYQVCHSLDKSANTSGIFSLAPWPEFASPNNILTVRDCTNSCVSYADIIATHGPQHLLSGHVLARPAIAFPQTYDESTLNPAPVLALQANFVKGGLLLNVAAQHNFIDGGGLLKLLDYLARALRGEEFQPEELRQANRDRRRLIDLLGPDEPLLDHGHLLRESSLLSEAKDAKGVQPAAISDVSKREEDIVDWTFFRIKGATVLALKDLTNSQIGRTYASAFVSTNDTLSAFLWRRLSSARASRHPDTISDTTYSKFSRALDARRALGLNREYLGQMGFNATCSLTFGQLSTQSLGETALYMRRAVTEANSLEQVRSWATFIAREPDKSRIMFGGKFNPDTDVGLSSLVHASVHDVDFGCHLGKPDLIRRPHFTPLESCVYFWTETRDGDVDILMCLKKGDRDALCSDKHWKQCVEFIG